MLSGFEACKRKFGGKRHLMFVHEGRATEKVPSGSTLEDLA
jgi:hypothetical protein